MNLAFKCAAMMAVLVIAGCAGTVRSGFDGREGRYEYIETHSLDKSTAYSRSINWIARNYNSANDVIQLKDSENGVIVVRAIAPFNVVGYTRYVEYTFETRIKENKAKFTFQMTGLSGAGGYYAQPGWAPPKAEMQQLTDQFVSIKNHMMLELAAKNDPNDF